ncbi:Uncharacterised protein [Yersinia aldovae]|uniref:Uncharacterized protein n=1 Tax=Yersinia aldovae TaxID=29483 RepID=A0A0T9TI74_YERAL|nr:Uncharacterised protein [Yersinia aldovae]
MPPSQIKAMEIKNINKVWQPKSYQHYNQCDS